ncbi:MAG: hypothetical protein JOZ72_11855 [Alphaproteobacteria bacterium]|nr:hypothetical protein [Alphaproteobacteria bacterium]
MRMMALAISAALLAASTTLAGAQTPAQSGPQNPAVKTDSGNNSDAPVKGANSYTQSEAQSRIAAMGYSHVSGLQKDGNGVWRATATKGGHRVHVSLDYQGNVNAD